MKVVFTEILLFLLFSYHAKGYGLPFDYDVYELVIQPFNSSDRIFSISNLISGQREVLNASYNFLG